MSPTPRGLVLWLGSGAQGAFQEMGGEVAQASTLLVAAALQGLVTAPVQRDAQAMRYAQIGRHWSCNCCLFGLEAVS